MRRLSAIVWAVDGAARWVCLKLIAAYQLVLSPLMGGGCRFTPTCSEYARHVFQSRSFPSAALLTIRRLLRCHPFSPGGEDLPPKN